MSDSISKSSNKTIAKNTVFLYVRMIFALVVSLYTSRVVLNTLGVEDYGVYNVVAGFVSLFSFLNATLSASIQRFYNYEGVKSGFEGFRSVYIIALIIHSLLALVIFLLLETVGLWYVNNVLVVPEGRLYAANVVFQTSIISLVLVLLQTPYIGAIMAKQRMNVYAYVSVYDVVVKLLIVLILPHIPYDSLQTFAILTLLINISNLLIYYLYCKRKFSEISFEMRFDRPLFKNILGFTGWNVIGTFAFMLKGQGVNMLLNSFFGPIINAARGIAYQVNTAISGFSQNITIAFRPQIVNSYAEGNFSRVTSLIFTESKICFMLIATLIIPVIVELNYILQLWLGTSVPDMTYGFTILVLIDTLICTLNTPCTQVIQATGKLKSYQIASTIVNILLIPLCWIFLQMGFNPYVVFILTIIISILNQLVCLIEVRKVFALKLKEYLYDVILSCLIFVIAISILPYSLKYLMDSSFSRFIFIVLSTILVAIPVAYRLGLTPSQREGVRIFIKSKFKKNV